MRVNCLLRNTALVHDIRNIIRVLVADKIQNNKNAHFPEIYYAIKAEIKDVDAETVGAIYNGLYGMHKEEYLSSVEEVVDFAGTEFVAQMGSILEDMFALPKDVQEQTVGNQSPERAAVTSIAKMFEDFTFEGSEKSKTVARKMQDIMIKAATSLLDKKKGPKPATLTEALSSFFAIEKNTFARLDGGINTLETLHGAIKEQVKNYIDGIANAGILSDGEIDLLRDQWDTYTAAVISANYDIFMGKAQQNSLVNLALQQIQLSGVDILDYNGNVKWSKLVTYNNPDTIVDAVKALFEKGIKEKNGTTTSYTPLQAERIGEYFRKLYMEKHEAAEKRALSNNRLKNNTPTNVISDFVKFEGFFNLVKDKDGRLMLSQADWKGFMKEIERQVKNANPNNINLRNELSGTDYVAVKLKEWLDTQLDENGKPKFTSYQKNVITEKLIDFIVAKLAPNTADASDIERLIALNTINKGNAFTAETQFAINKVVGVSDISQTVLSQLRQLTQAAAAVMNSSVGTVQVNGKTVNRGAYAFQAIAEIDRKIKELLREHAISKSNQQRIFKYLSDVMGGGTVSLLLNPNNVLENPMTQLGTNIVESVNLFHLLRKDPMLFVRTFGNFQSVFWKAWSNYAFGGASNELANEGELSNELQSSERLRGRSFVEEMKKGVNISIKGKSITLPGWSAVIVKAPQYGVSVAARFLMNSFDAATTASLMRKRMFQSAYNTLIDQGKTPAETRAIMAGAINIPSTVLAEIKTENQRIKQILKTSGIFVSDSMMAQNESDMFLSVYETIIREAGTDVGATLKQATEVTKALIESSQAQSKSLGGKKQLQSKDLLTWAIYGLANGILGGQKSIFKASKEAESRGDLGYAARLQLAGTTYQTAIGKFVGGVANFMVLAISATPYGYFQGTSLRNQRNNYKRDNSLTGVIGNKNGIDAFAVDPEQLRRWNLLHGQMQSIYTRSLMGTIAMTAFILKALLKKDDDEDEIWLDNLMATKSGRRFIQKHLPFGLSMMVPYFYGREGDEDGELVRVMEMFNTYTGKDFDKYDNLMRSLKKKNLSDEQRTDIWTRIVGGFAPGYNLNQAEQITKFTDVVKSAMNKNLTSAVEFDEKVSKEIYKDAEGIFENLFINGSVDTFNRLFENRYK